jgi:hypothetical protein
VILRGGRRDVGFVITRRSLSRGRVFVWILLSSHTVFVTFSLVELFTT